MGACNIELELKGKLSKPQIQKAFKDQQWHDKEYNGSQEGYSGDFQTVHGFELYTDQIFEDYESAENYCLDNAVKWEYVLAVYYKDGKDINTLLCGWGAC